GASGRAVGVLAVDRPSNHTNRSIEAILCALNTGVEQKFPEVRQRRHLLTSEANEDNNKQSFNESTTATTVLPQNSTDMSNTTAIGNGTQSPSTTSIAPQDPILPQKGAA
ncbi:unnamed protein product, partial [Medioppia subpectinata]